MSISQRALAILFAVIATGGATQLLLGASPRAGSTLPGPWKLAAWTVPIGATAPQAAGVIHTDFERGFIRAEIYSVADLVKHKSEKAIREAGRLRVEGKDYVMHDGDVCHFLFNV